MQAVQTKKNKSFVSRYIEEDENFWKKYIAACTDSGLAKTVYCKEKQLNYARFFYWIKRLSAKAIQQPLGSEINSLLPVRLMPEGKREGNVLCTLTLRNGCQLEIHDQQSLSQILTMWG